MTSPDEHAADNAAEPAAQHADAPADVPAAPADSDVEVEVADEPLAPERQRALDAVLAVLREAGLDWTALSRTSLSVDLPGEKKLQTPCRFDVGPHALGVHAFVCRQPDENFTGVYRWMLERNMKMFAFGFALDGVGDIYLDAKLPLEAATPHGVDRLLGSVLEYADGSFNTILELGFASSIRKEWEWRISRGESVRNLEAFRGPLRLDDLGSPRDEQPSGQPASDQPR